jgi:PPOX class probable F420-dependent enzyme
MAELNIDPSVLQYIEGHRNAVLATQRFKGAPQQTLISYHFDGRNFAISTRGPSQKAKNLRRRPEASIAVIDGPAQLIVTGQMRVIESPEEVYRLHRERMSQVSQRAESDEELVERLRREERVVLLLEPERFYPTTMNRGAR